MFNECIFKQCGKIDLIETWFLAILACNSKKPLKSSFLSFMTTAGCEPQTDHRHSSTLQTADENDHFSGFGCK